MSEGPQPQQHQRKVPGLESVQRATPAGRDTDVDAALELIRRMERPQLLALSALLLADLGQSHADQLTKDELRVRAETLAGAARSSGHYGRVVCPICGKPKQQHALGMHLFRQHADHLALMQPGRGPRVAG